MKKSGIVILFLATLLLNSMCAFSETAEGQGEQGLEEIQPLVEMNDLKGTEGMSLEELTEAFSETAMGEYFDSATGFSFQYPSFFQFSEEEGATARSEDGKASLVIETLANDGSLTEQMLQEAIGLEVPDAQVRKNEQNGCLRVDRTEDEGRTCRTDVYILTEKSFHHLILSYPSDQKEKYAPYIEYMINTVSTSGSEQG